MEQLVVQGSLIEVKGNKVLTKQGAMLSTYNLNYYRILEEKENDDVQG